MLPSSDGTPPALPLHLQGLVWSLNETSLPFLLNFLSPHLTKVAITTDELRRPDERVGSWLKLPDEVVPVMRSAIKMFPPSIQDICLKLGNGPETRLTEEVSAYVLRCGEALRRFATNVVLSTEAIVHLMKLPNLETWATEQGPPQVSDLINHGVPDGVTSLFPSLQALDLRSEVASKWLPLFEVAKGRTPPWIMAGDSLPMICYDDPTLPIDLSMVSKFLPFTDLVELRIRMECMYGGPCISKLTDKDVERMAIALPKLEALSLGEWPCDSDSCPTTIRSLLFLSINCTKLRYLNIHFRTTVLRADMLDLLGDARSQGLRSKPRCALRTLVTRNMRLVLFDYDPVLVSMGLLMIFPSLDMLITSWGTPWVLLDSMVKVMRQVEVIPDLTEELMICLNEAREQADGGVPTRSAVSSHLSLGLASERGWVCLLTSRFIHFARMK